MIARTKKEIELYLSDLGFALLDYYRDGKRLRVIVRDFYGYKYDIDIDSGKGNSSRHAVCPSNPYSLENISKWLSNNNKTFVLCENNTYVSKDKYNLKFYCNECDDVFITCWNQIRSGYGCSVCSGRQTGEKHSLADIRKDLLEEWSSKNIFSPKDVSVGSKKKAIWICKNCSFEWETSICTRTSLERNCPNCSTSKGEKKVDEILSNRLKAYTRQQTFVSCRNILPLPFDFYIPDYALAIEYHGKQHYESVEFFGGKNAFKQRKKNDKIKENYCKDNNINLLIIPYWEYGNIENILHNKLLEIEGSV